MAWTDPSANHDIVVRTQPPPHLVPQNDRESVHWAVAPFTTPDAAKNILESLLGSIPPPSHFPKLWFLYIVVYLASGGLAVATAVQYRLEKRLKEARAALAKYTEVYTAANPAANEAIKLECKAALQWYLDTKAQLASFDRVSWKSTPLMQTFWKFTGNSAARVQHSWVPLQRRTKQRSLICL
jgi:hypothetical protein